jgi:hypothetical protein
MHVVRKVFVLDRDVLVGESWVRAGGCLGCGLFDGFCIHFLVAIFAAIPLHGRLCSKPGILLCVLLIVSEEVLVHVELIYGELEERGLTIARLAHDPLFEALEGKLREPLHHVLISRNGDTGLPHEKALRPGEQIVTGGLDLFVIAGVTEFEQYFESFRVIFLEDDDAVLGFLLNVSVSSWPHYEMHATYKHPMTASVQEPVAIMAKDESMAFECLLALLAIYNSEVSEFGIMVPLAELVEHVGATSEFQFNGEFPGVLRFEDGVDADVLELLGAECNFL